MGMIGMMGPRNDQTKPSRHSTIRACVGVDHGISPVNPGEQGRVQVASPIYTNTQYTSPGISPLYLIFPRSFQLYGWKIWGIRGISYIPVINNQFGWPQSVAESQAMDDVMDRQDIANYIQARPPARRWLDDGILMGLHDLKT